MKKTFILAATIFASVIAFNAHAQQVAPPPPPQEPGRIAPPPSAPMQQALQQVTTYSGSVADWIANDDYVYDGFYLQTQSEKLVVKFPPHLGSRLTSALTKGNSVTVNGVTNVNPEGVKEIHFISIAANGKTFYDTAAAVPPSTANADAFINGSGKITSVQTDKQGSANGYMLDNKTILRLPPPVANQLSQMAATGSTVSYTGMKKTTKDGEVSSGDYTIVHPQTITLNGTQYLTK